MLRCMTPPRKAQLAARPLTTKMATKQATRQNQAISLKGSTKVSPDASLPCHTAKANVFAPCQIVTEFFEYSVNR